MKDNKDKLQFLAPNLGEDISIDIGGKDIVKRKVVKLLGIKIDNNFRFEDHVSSLCKKTSQKLHELARTSTYMCSRKLEVLMKSFIISKFSYCPILWMFTSHRRFCPLLYLDRYMVSSSTTAQIASFR